MATTPYDLNTFIKLNYKGFSKAEAKVADYVLAHPCEILYMAITDLSDACGVGDTTVFRFCKAIGLNGYQEFKVLLAQALSNIGSKTKIVYSGEVQAADTMEGTCQSTLNDALYALNSTFELINYEMLEKAVSMIEKAARIHFFGNGASGNAAMDAKNKFIRIIPNVECVLDSHIQAISAAMMRSEDLAIIYSYGGSNKDALDIMRIVKENNVPIIVITRFAKSPSTKYADIVLLCGSNEGPLQGGSTSARISQIFWTDLLYNAYFRRNYEQSSYNKTLTTKAVSSKLL
ncbi:MAG: MurR/RpiR family transcriptional regulator [Clostridia bacterium]